MRALKVIWAFAIASAPPTAMAAPGASQAITPAANGTYIVDQDTPDNSISVWQVTALSEVNAVRAKLTVRRTGLSGTNPTFGLELLNDADRVQFQAFTKPGKTTLIPLISEEVDHTEKACLASGMYVSSFEVGETVDVEVDWTTTGEVTVTLRNKISRAINVTNGYERCTVKMRGGPPTALKIISMTGEAEWKPLRLGKTSALP